MSVWALQQDGKIFLLPHSPQPVHHTALLVPSREHLSNIFPSPHPHSLDLSQPSLSPLDDRHPGFSCSNSRLCSAQVASLGLKYTVPSSHLPVQSPREQGALITFPAFLSQNCPLATLPEEGLEALPQGGALPGCRPFCPMNFCTDHSLYGEYPSPHSALTTPPANSGLSQDSALESPLGSPRLFSWQPHS